MKFLDEAIIELVGGGGGKGCASFRREKYVPKGGPDGGNGGNGGSVIFKTHGGLTTLMDVHYHRFFRAGHGENGKGKQMTGKSGADKIVRMPVGTVVYDAKTDEPLADLDKDGIEWVAAKGGRGGRGNMCFVSSTHQAPTEFEEGEKGEHRKVRLELKLLADVGLVGMPNAGKSTLVSAVSNARPKIADYPFTTKTPCLGLVRLKDGRSFVMADIPGLIEGAHEGAGMGIKFLRHIERTRIILHLVDVSDHAYPDPASSYKSIRNELKSFDPKLLKRPEIVVLTKMDLPDAEILRDEAKKTIKRAGAKRIVAISAASHDGLDELLIAIGKLL